MSTLRVFSVFDSKLEAYMAPFFMRTRGEALRGFMDTCADRESMLAKHPEDYTLFELGSWNEGTASFDMLETPHSLGTALELLSRGQAA